jgi:hypothetical protein
MRGMLVVAGSLALLLTACASSGPTITTNFDPQIDFSGFESYGFMQPLSTDRPNGVRTRLSDMLMGSMNRVMASRGLEQSDAPDLLINFFVNTESRMDVRTVPTVNTFHGYRRGRYSTWMTYSTTVREYTRGTLSIDLVDASQNLLVWEGVAQGRLRDDVNNMTVEQIHGVVSQVMAEFAQDGK